MAQDLVSVPEVAEMLGVSRQRVHQIIQTYPDFPQPEAELAVGRIWRRDLVARWIASHPRRTGRPSNAAPQLHGGNRPPAGGAGGSRGGRKGRPT